MPMASWMTPTLSRDSRLELNHGGNRMEARAVLRIPTLVLGIDVFRFGCKASFEHVKTVHSVPLQA